MNSISRVTLLVIAAGAIVGNGLRTLEAQQALAPRIAAADKGPSKIDVASYPPEMQKAYALFTKKCGLCHSVARVINSDYVLEGDWEADVHNMTARAGKLISPADAQQIYDFLVYDSKIRKADLYQARQLAAAKPAVRAIQPADPVSKARRVANYSPDMIAAFDKGPAKIDVSSYPPELQQAYQVFTKKCGVCHTVARAINVDFVLETDWEADVNDMTARSGKMISSDEAKQIYDFLVYDSKVRKADLYHQRQLEESSKLSNGAEPE
jgi:mono/diheme cytochrome c family protein/cytochrome c5